MTRRLRSLVRFRPIATLAAASLWAASALAAPPTPGASPHDPARSPYRPDFAPSVIPASNQQGAGSLQIVVVAVENHGLVKGASSLSVRLFLSTTPQPSGSAIGAKTSSDVPMPGETSHVGLSPTVPAGTAPGAYYLCGVVSSGAREISDANNVDCVPLTVTSAAARATAREGLSRATPRPAATPLRRSP